MKSGLTPKDHFGDGIQHGVDACSRKGLQLVYGLCLGALGAFVRQARQLVRSSTILRI